MDKLTTCPQDAPYFDGSSCIACLLPNYFDFQTEKCLTCGKDYHFDQKDKECKPANNSVSPHYPAYNSNLD